MFLSLWKIGIKDCKLLRLEDAYSIHRIVYSLFPKLPAENRDFLFFDKGFEKGIRKILILSKRKPENTKIGNLEAKEVSDSFLEFDNYAFEILLNPVKRNGKTQNTIPVIGKENLIKWFIEKSPQWGFETDEQSLTLEKIFVQEFKKGNQNSNYTFSSVLFKGKLKVVDRNLFIKSFKEGIGKGKAFGFGLLQIIPIQIQKEEK